MFTNDYKVKTVIMDDKALNRTLSRLAHQIVESNRGVENLAFIGIRTRGVQIAERLIEKIEPLEGRLSAPGVAAPEDAVSDPEGFLALLGTEVTWS